MTWRIRPPANFATGPGDPPIIPLKSMEPAAEDPAVGQTVSQAMMQRLDAMEQDLSGGTTYTGAVRWMIPYADLLTVLLGLFLLVIALYAHEKQVVDASLSQTRKALAVQTAEATATKTRLATIRHRLEAISGPLSREEAGIFEESAGSKIPPAAPLDARLMAIPDIEVQRQERGIVVRLPDSLLFPSGSDALTPGARTTLDRLAPVLRDNPTPIKIEGHTDNAPIATGRFPSNWELSTARATQIVRYLITQRGFSPGRLSASGYGEFHPIATNSSIEGKQKNRRVDIVLMNADAAKQEPPPAPQTSSGKLSAKVSGKESPRPTAVYHMTAPLAE
ncbi:MAG: OmpA family protein [Vampirovibrionales bacterium]|nr:OmpA family protein [Vampirovibrionales bacterium]